MGLRLGVLISGGGTNLQALLDACAAPDFPAEVALVISNRPGAGGLARARAAGVPSTVIDHRGYADRATFDAAMDAALRAAGVELVCMAGFMRLITGGFVARWPARMINIHPSLLPAYKGLNTHARVLADGGRITGCTVHVVSEAMDAGPILAQAAVPVAAHDTAASLGRRVGRQERRLYPMVVRAMAEGRVAITDGVATIAGAAPADQPEGALAAPWLSGGETN